MTKTLDEFRATFATAQRETIDARAAELIAEEMTLRDLRQARKLTQDRMAEMLGMEQENVSRLESRTDLLLSTLRSYVAAMSGNRLCDQALFICGNPGSKPPSFLIRKGHEGIGHIAVQPENETVRRIAQFTDVSGPRPQ